MLLKTPSVRYSFSGHETFPFRYTWLPKGVQGVIEEPNLFNQDNAMVELGVGKNMVTSIRFWCETLSLIEFSKGGHRPTKLGKFLLTEKGRDPYLEDVGTLWLLHWLLVSRGERASTWHLAFTQFSVDPFNSETLIKWLLKLISEIPNVRATPASIKRDVNVFLRTYAPSRHHRKDSVLEDTFDCPLVELGLLREIDKTVYQFVRGGKSSLPDEVFLFALLDFWQRISPDQKSISFDRLMHGGGSLGGAFKLTENALVERLERLPKDSGITFSETAGLRQVLRRAKYITSPLDVLAGYYNN